jgi:hypothetical protein
MKKENEIEEGKKRIEQGETREEKKSRLKGG